MLKYQILSKSVQKFSYPNKPTEKSLQQEISPLKSEYTDGNKMPWLYGTESFNTMSINAYTKPIKFTKKNLILLFQVAF